MNIIKTLAYLGYIGPVISLIIFVIFITTELISKNISIPIFILYILCIFISFLLNDFLKKTIRQKRPQESKSITMFEAKIDKNSLGMPSGHAQTSSLLLTLSYLTNLPILLLLLLLILFFITVWQRYMYKKHTLNQLLFGTITGVLFSEIYWHILILPKIKNLKINQTNKVSNNES